jgi:hypothetical protein
MENFNFQSLSNYSIIKRVIYILSLDQKLVFHVIIIYPYPPYFDLNASFSSGDFFVIGRIQNILCVLKFDAQREKRERRTQHNKRETEKCARTVQYM